MRLPLLMLAGRDGEFDTPELESRTTPRLTFSNTLPAAAVAPAAAPE